MYTDFLPTKDLLTVSRQYGKVPTLRKDDNVIPSASEIPAMITSLRNPRKRTVSIGSQSQADVYEAVAYREWRRNSQSAPPGLHERTGRAASDAGSHTERHEKAISRELHMNGTEFQSESLAHDHEPCASREEVTRAQLDDEGNPSRETANGYHTVETLNTAGDKAADKQGFHKIHVPRVRYDVEVVTKLVVYTGMKVESGSA